MASRRNRIVLTWWENVENGKCIGDKDHGTLQQINSCAVSAGETVLLK